MTDPKPLSDERVKEITETIGAAMSLDWHLSIKKELLEHIAWLTAEKESETKWAHEYQSENALLREVVEAAENYVEADANCVPCRLCKDSGYIHTQTGPEEGFTETCQCQEYRSWRDGAWTELLAALSRVKEKHENG